MATGVLPSFEPEEPGPEAPTGRWTVVVGPGRSGSTFLDQALGAKGYVTVGELFHVWHRVGLENQLCGCGLASQECPFWSQVLAQALGPDWRQRCGDLEAMRLRHGQYWSWPKMVLRPQAWANSVRELIEATAALADAIEAYIGPRDQIWDSSKSAFEVRLLAEAGRAPDLVLLTRHPAAVAYSWGRAKVRPETDGRVMPRHGVIGSSLRWSFAVVSGLVEARRTGRPATHLDYLALGDVLDNSGLFDADRPPVAAAATGDRSRTERAGYDGDRWPHAIGGNPIRWESTSVTFEPDMRWRAQMPGLQRFGALVWAGWGLVGIAVGTRLGWCRRPSSSIPDREA